MLPSALLFHFDKLFDSSDEFLVWQFIYMQNTTALFSLSLSRIAESLGKTAIEINQMIVNLHSKGLLSLDAVESGDPHSLFDASPALAKLDALIAEEEGIAKQEETVADPTDPNVLKDLVETFQAELGRLLSPMEIEDLTKTVRDDQVSPLIVKEALREAVMNNKPNWKYIHAILNSWRREGITSLQQVHARRQERQAQQPENVQVSAEFQDAMNLWSD